MQTFAREIKTEADITDTMCVFVVVNIYMSWI